MKFLKFLGIPPTLDQMTPNDPILKMWPSYLFWLSNDLHVKPAEWPQMTFLETEFLIPGRMSPLSLMVAAKTNHFDFELVT